MRWLYTPLLVLAVIVTFSFRTPRAYAVAYPTRVGTDAAQYFASSDPWTMAMTVPSTGQNRALVCVVGIGGAGGAPTSMTWNGTGMTKIIDGTTLPAQQQTDGVMFYLANPTAATANVVANWGSNKQGFLICATFQDMHQTSGTVIDASGQANTAAGTSISKQITTATDGDVIITWFGIGSTASAHTPGGGQSLIASVLESNIDAGASDIGQTTAGNITTSWSWTTAASGDLFAVALKYQAPTASAAASPPPLEQIWIF